jgi:hypothetical protein
MERIKLLKSRKSTVIRLGVILFSIIIATLLYANLTKTNEPSPNDLKLYLKNNKLDAGADVNGDFQQVYYIYKGKRQYVTDGASNHTWVRSSGNYIAWLETPNQQNNSLVVLYNVLTKAKTQLTFYGVSSWVQLEGNRVVWEDRNGEKPEIYYYDGVLVSKITDGKYPSARPAIHGNRVAYAQELSMNNFQVIVYNTDSKLSEVVATGDSANAWPSFDGDKLITNNSVY